MWAGLAGALLVFTGIWHATEFLMGGRTADTRRLIPIGILYLILGIMIVTMTGGWIVQLIALIVTSIFLVVAFGIAAGERGVCGVPEV